MNNNSMWCVKEGMVLKEAKDVIEKVMINNRDEDPMEALYMVDLIQRLGIEHYFEDEIKACLQKQHSTFIFTTTNHQLHLHDVALTFRLLRQAGHHVQPPDVLFDSLKIIHKRKFRDEYGEDVRSLIALYEATQLSIEGEDILDDASFVCCELLQAWLTRHNNNDDDDDEEEEDAIYYVSNALQQPLHHSLSRFMDRTRRRRSSIFLNKSNHDDWALILEELAEINSCMLRLTNQNEIVQVSKWWKDLKLAKDTKFAGYQPLKWYMWSMACFTDPSFSEQRIELTKPVSLIYIIDDIFDVYGTLHQLTIFTDAVNRWELSGTEQLPEFMKIYLSLLFDTTYDFAERIYKKHGFNPIDTLKNSWMKYLNAALEESQRLNSGHLPNTKEYLKNGIVTTGVHVVLVHAFVLFDHHHDLTNKTVATMNHFPNIIYSVAKILRFHDDLEGTKVNQNGLDGSSFVCNGHV